MQYIAIGGYQRLQECGLLGSMGAMRRSLQKVSLIVAFLILVAVMVVYGWARMSLPVTDGATLVPGLGQTVELRRTDAGLVTIRAENDRDAWFGLGYAHAQDRLWQMVSLRRFALGRLSEIVGDATIEIDIAQRRLGLDALTRRQFKILDSETQRALTAYADGINAFLSTHDGPLPPEFLALRFEPEPWAPHHGLLWGRIMAYQLSGRWRDDLARERLLTEVGAEKMIQLWPAMTSELAGRAPSKHRETVSLPPPYLPPPMGASNAWAVGPGKSATGAPLLAGDPHLGLSLPGTWYMARLEIGDRWVEGATAPGVPFVILGRNRHLGWSVTSSEADLQDVQHITADDIDRRVDDTIKVKGGDQRNITLMFADGAPVIGGGLLDGSGDTGIALLATSLLAGDTTPGAFAGLDRATDMSAARAALARFRAPFMNVILADDAGHIARIYAGDVPRRSGYSGRLPLHRDMTRWASLPSNELMDGPTDPAAGVVGNANEKTPELENIGFSLAGDWPDPARARRLQQLLGRDIPFGTDAMRRMQLDTVDVTAQAWRGFLETMKLTGAAAAARDMMLDWDGSMRRDAAQPLIYATWMAALKRAVFADELTGAFGVLPLPGPMRLKTMIDDDSIWCDLVKTQQKREHCADLPEAAFTETISILSKSYGDELDDWIWGNAHNAFFDNKLLGRLPFIGGLFNLQIATPGGDRTLNRGASPRVAGAGGAFPHIHGAGFRAVHDLSGAPSRYMTVPGQSGNPFSDHYDDLLAPWRDGVMLGFDASAAAVLTLRPQNR